ncbi:MAG: hypothetical protein ACXWJJ_06120 [Ramlibacter sp.]
MKNFGILVSGIVLAAAAHAATFQDWADARPESQLDVARTAHLGLYKVSALVRDAATQKVLGQPTLLTKPGQLSTVEIGIDKGPQGSYMYRLLLTVQADGTAATFRSEFLRNGQVTGATSGTLQVQDEPNALATGQRQEGHGFLPVELGLRPVLQELAGVDAEAKALELKLDTAQTTPAERAQAEERLQVLARERARLSLQISAARERARSPLVMHLSAAN